MYIEHWPIVRCVALAHDDSLSNARATPPPAKSLSFSRADRHNPDVPATLALTRVHMPSLRMPRRGTPRPDVARRRPLFACAVEYDRVFALMTAAGAGPHVLMGWNHVLRYLNDTLGIRNRWGARLKRRQIEHWIVHYGFPFLPGIKTRRAKYTCVTLERAIDAWILSRPRNGVRELFAFIPEPRDARGPRSTGVASPWIPRVRFSSSIPRASRSL